jgi:tetratricopeptide (TPR) repeat protein
VFVKPGVLLVVALLAAASACAQTIDWLDVHNRTLRGIDLLYNMEFDASARTFDSVRQLAPGDPRGYFFGSMVDFWRSALGRDEREYDKFIEGTERVIDVCEGLLDANPRDVKARFYLGGILGYRGLAHQANGSILKAVKDGKVGFGYLEEAVRMDTSLYDARMGFGLFTYLVAKVPRSFKWVTSVLGFSGDLEGGLRLMSEAAAHGVYTRSEASFFLSQFLFAEHRYDEAFAYLTPLLKQYPDNALFQVLAANWYLRINKPDEALAAAQKAAEVNTRKKLHYAEESIYSTLGGIYFNKNDFAQARDNYTVYLEKAPNRDRIGNWAYYRLGVAQEICGDRVKAVETYGRMREVEDKKRASDTYYYRRGQELIRKPLGEAEILLLKAGNSSDRKEYDTAQNLFNASLEKAGSDPDLQVRILYAVQLMQFEQERYGDVLETANRIFALRPRAELWIIPHALVKRGQALAKSGRQPEARTAFERAAEYEEYDFELSLKNRIEDELDKLDSNK